VSLEIELKLTAAPADLRRLLKSAEVAALALSPARAQRLFSSYYDTPTLALTQAGIALRLRKIGRRHVLTVKTRGESHAGLHARGEFEAAAPGGQLDLAALVGLDPATAALLEASAEALAPLFSTEFRRTALQVRLPDGGRAELAFDLGEIRAGGAVAAISEIEIELLEGRPAEVFALARQLCRLAPLRIGNRSKAERAFALLAPIEPAPKYASALALSSELPAAQACGQLLAGALAQLEANEDGAVHAADPEFLHQARVALRRLRALLRLFKPLLTATELDALRPRLRALGHRLGACRDWDVLCTETLPKLRLGLAEPGALDGLLDGLMQSAEKRRADAQADVRRALDEADYTDLKLAVGALTASLQEPQVAPQEDLGSFARSQLKRARRRVREAHAQLQPDSIEALHTLRIEVKNLRYACDVLGSAFAPKRVRRYVRRLTGLQALLGDFNDAAVAGPRLRALEAAPDYALGLIDGYAAARIYSARAALPKAWARFMRAKRFW